MLNSEHKLHHHFRHNIEVHCTLCAHESDHLLLQLNVKSQKKLWQNMQPEARLLTVTEAQATFEAEDNQWLEHEQVAAVARLRRIPLTRNITLRGIAIQCF